MAPRTADTGANSAPSKYGRRGRTAPSRRSRLGTHVTSRPTQSWPRRSSSNQSVIGPYKDDPPSSVRMHTASTNEKTESLPFVPGCVTSSAPAARDKKPCAKTSSFPRRLPKMAEGQVGLCARREVWGVGRAPGRSGRGLRSARRVQWDLRTQLSKGRTF